MLTKVVLTLNVSCKSAALIVWAKKKTIEGSFHYEREMKYFCFFIFLLRLASERSNKINIKKQKNAPFHARNGNGP